LALNEDWGDPRDYNITVVKKGQKLDTEYTVTPSPKSGVPSEANKMLQVTSIDLKALMRGEDPFGRATVNVEHGDAIQSEDNPFGQDFN